MGGRRKGPASLHTGIAIDYQGGYASGKRDYFQDRTYLVPTVKFQRNGA